MQTKSLEPKVSSGIWKTYFNVIKKYFCFKGRSSRYELSAFLIVNFIILFLLEFAQRATGFIKTFAVIDLVYKIGVFLPFLGLLVRRTHDFGKNGWWAGSLVILMALPVFLGILFNFQILILLSFVAYLFSIFFFFKKSQQEGNLYGEPNITNKSKITGFVTFVGWIVYILPLLMVAFIIVMSINRYQQESIVYQIKQNVSDIQKFNQNQKDYSLINASYLLKNNILNAQKCPDIKETDCLQNEFGGELIVSGNPYAKYKNMIYILNELSSQECMLLATSDWGPNYLGAIISSQKLDIKDFSPEKTSATMDCRCEKDTCSVGLVFN